VPPVKETTTAAAKATHAAHTAAPRRHTIRALRPVESTNTGVVSAEGERE
jgi:hypothetical protein